MTAGTSHDHGTTVLAGLRGHGEVHEFAPGQSLLARGGPGDGLYVLDEGLVKLVVPGRDGRPLLLAVRGPGDVAGEGAALDGRPRSAAVVALTPVRARWVPRDRLLALVEQDPDLRAHLLTLVLARLQDASGVEDDC